MVMKLQKTGPGSLPGSLKLVYAFTLKHVVLEVLSKTKFHSWRFIHYFLILNPLGVRIFL